MKATLQVLMGRYVPTPVSSAFVQAIQQVEVRQVLEGRSTFSLTLSLQRTRGSDGAFTLLESLTTGPVPSMRIILVLTVGGLPTVLSDGFVTQQSVEPAAGPDRPPTLTLVGEDVSVKLDLKEKSLEWPGMSAAEIAPLVMLEYPELGLVPLVIPPDLVDPPDPLDWTPLQQGTDYAFLRQLAGRFGYTFRVQPGPVPGANLGYFGPRLHPPVATPLPALTCGGVPGANCDGLRFTYDAMKPTTLVGTVLDADLSTEVPIDTVLLPTDPFAARPPISIQGPFHRQRYVDWTTGGDTAKALAWALGEVAASQQMVVVATGRIDLIRYGRALLPWHLVGVRGAGAAYDGMYFVREVTHHIGVGRYSADFVLTRGGLGSLVSTVPV